MTAYGTPFIHTTSEAVQEAKEKRRRVLEAAEQTRRANYERFLRRLALVQRSLRERKTKNRLATSRENRYSY